MAIKERNFTQTAPADIPKDAVYERCNFARLQPADATEGAALGVRLFPGDDTPRTFINCNLLNCEPPPGSVVSGCNTKLVRKGVPSATKEDDVVIVDGVEISRVTYHDYIGLGRWTPSGYEYEVPAIVGPEDY